MINLFKIKTGFPYYINHLVIALIIGFIFQNFFVGAAFYIGRELRDWEKLGHFDHKGFWWPVVACTILQLISIYQRII
tara:strand:+ start:884 stop:1117 length:234 start_codon:yes stop_codon:yes gene_type:complete